MKILAIETSCDETAAAVIEKLNSTSPIKLLSSIISSSLKLHAQTGGIIPEIAAREQIKYTIPVIEKTLADANSKKDHIDAIAVTYGPGLIGSLLVGVETAKTLAYLWNKPIIPVNHLLGHIYANWLTTKDQIPKTIEFPSLALIASGNHTDLLLLKNHGKIKWLGGTLDDAAGEAFDKIGRMLNLQYPAGPMIEELSRKGNPKAFRFPRPMIGSGNFDFSFSGLKAAVLREVKTHDKLNDQLIYNIARGTQDAIIDVIARKTVKAAKKYKVKSILLGGGVAANQSLQNKLNVNCQMLNVKFFAPPKSLCTDNAAMIGAYAAFNYKPIPWQKITANPELYFH